MTGSVGQRVAGALVCMWGTCVAQLCRDHWGKKKTLPGVQPYQSPPPPRSWHPVFGNGAASLTLRSSSPRQRSAARDDRRGGVRRTTHPLSATRAGRPCQRRHHKCTRHLARPTHAQARHAGPGPPTLCPLHGQAGATHSQRPVFVDSCAPITPAFWVWWPGVTAGVGPNGVTIWWRYTWFTAI